LPYSKLRVSGWQPMRLLLDECVPAGLRRALPNHIVSTVVIEGWSGVKNGKLLALAAQSFDAFVTVDKNLPYQQNQASLPLTVLVLDATSNELSVLLTLVPALEAELALVKPRSYVLVRAGA
jgi:predicted nuclease of predicted toxin-antitoxin system